MKKTSPNRDPVVFEELTCAFCRGIGTDPFDIMSALSTCCVCGGSGKVLLKSPTVACAHCQGTGAVKTLTCTTCSGRGSVSKPLQPTVTCPVCRGSGDDASAPAMACLTCLGNGWVTKQLKEGEMIS